MRKITAAAAAGKRGKVSRTDRCANALSAHRSHLHGYTTLRAREAGGWRSLTWLRRARPEKQASQEKAEATQGSRGFHGWGAWRFISFKIHMSSSVIFPWHSQRKGESFDASSACEFKEGGGYLSSFRTKFAVCPTVPFVSLLCAPRVKLVTGVRAERGEKSRRVVFPSAHSEARLSSIKQYSCHYSPTWIVCSCRLVSVRHTSEACDSAHGLRDWHGWPTITRKARQAALRTRCHWRT